jgi:uncharacterized protein (DUF302 family)
MVREWIHEWSDVQGGIVSEIGYGHVKTLKDGTFERAVQRVTEALRAEGFGVLTEIDVKHTLKQKLDVEFRPYVIFGACNPTLARRALEAEPQIGLLLPCNVVVQEVEGGVAVSIADPRGLFRLVGNPALEPVVEEAESRLRRVAEALG